MLCSNLGRNPTTSPRKPNHSARISSVMKKFKLLALTGAIAALCGAAASAAPVITSVTASGPGCAVAADCTGSFSSTINAANRSIDLTKAFSSVNPITLTFHVVHQQGGGPSYDI